MAVLTRERREEPGAAESGSSRTSGGDVARCVQWLVAGCSLGAAALHFAYSPSHFAEYWAYGLFFVGVAWLQLLFSLGVILRPTRALLVAGIGLNAAVIVVWVLSRTVGIWVGPNATVTEAATFPDILSSSLELIVVIGATLLLFHPGWLTRRFSVQWTSPVIVGSAIVLIAGSGGYALTPHFANAHNHAAAITGSTPCEKAGPPASEGQVLNSAGHFHRGPVPQQPVDEPTRLQLQVQQEQARAVAVKYRTVADAQAAGYRESTVYVPCIGAHYTNAALAGRFDPTAPSELLYDGTQPGSRIIGLSYLVFHPGGAPEGFAGPNDVWHQHTFNGGLCIAGGGIVIGAESTSPAACAARGGHKVALTDIWMLHDWVVPGFECSWGVFASECPELGGRTGGTPWDTPDPSGRPIPQD